MKKLVLGLLSLLLCTFLLISCNETEKTSDNGIGGDDGSHDSEDTNNGENESGGEIPHMHLFDENKYCSGCGYQEGTEGLSYSLVENGEAYLVTSIGTATGDNIVISNFYQGKPVVGIAEHAFYHCSELTSITIPEGIKSVASYAFFDCTRLEKITISNSVISIGSSAFYNTAYYNNASNWENGVLYIGKHLVNVQTTLSGAYTVKEGTCCIASYAFSYCVDLTSITIPDSVIGIGEGVFSGCNKLTAFVVTPGSSQYHSAGNCLIDTVEKNLIAGCNNSLIPTDGSVTSIGDGAFSDLTGITSINIPDGVTSIGKYAFSACTNLASVTIPISVKSIGTAAFGHCTGLTAVHITDLAAWCEVVSVGISNPLYHAKKLYLNGTLVTDLVIPEGVTGIGEGVFQMCEDIVSVTIPSSVTNIGDYAFNGCTGLASVTIPNSVTSIGNYAFYGCTELASINIGDGVTSIGEYAYGKTAYYNNASNWESGSLYVGKYLISVSRSMHWGSYTVKDGTIGIGALAFDDCTGITSITIPDSVKSISYGAFSYHMNIETARIPASLASYIPKANLKTVIITGGDEIGWYDFYACTDLTDVIVEDGVKRIASNAFYNCINLKSVTIPNSVTSIGSEAFRNCTSLTSFIIGDGVMSIGDNAFYSCTALTSFTIPNSVTSIGNYAFYGCTELASINIGDGVTSIGAYVCYNTAYYNNASNWESGVLYMGKYLVDAQTTLSGTYTVKDGTLGVCPYAFYNCTDLTSIAIPDSVKSIGRSAFEDCTGLTAVHITDLAAWCEISFDLDSNPLHCAKKLYLNGMLVTDLVIPEGVTGIGEGVFQMCEDIVSVTIPNSVISIGAHAFSGCTGLASITIGDGVASIESGAFGFCSALMSITVANGNSEYHSSGNCLIETASKTLLLGCQSSVIPADGSVTSISSSAFAYCRGLTAITIPSSVTSIGALAFLWCTELASIIIGDGVTSIGHNAFVATAYYSDASNWENGVLYIGNYLVDTQDTLSGKYTVKDGTLCIASQAFDHCTDLSSVTIPNSVTSIGGYAFSYCSSLKSITFTGTKAQWQNISKGINWKESTPTITVTCTDGDCPAT